MLLACHIALVLNSTWDVVAASCHRHVGCCGPQWVFSVMRRVLPLLAMSKIVFDMTRRRATLLVMSLCLQKCCS